MHFAHTNLQRVKFCHYTRLYGMIPIQLLKIWIQMDHKIAIL